MEAIDKIGNGDNWITLVLFVLFLLVFLLKELNSTKLNAVFFLLFNTLHIKKKVKNVAFFYNFFNFILFLFVTQVYALLMYFYKISLPETQERGFYVFAKIFITTVCFFIIKWTLEFFVASKFLFKQETRNYLKSKTIFFHSISFPTYGGLLLYTFSSFPLKILILTTLFMFLIGFIKQIKHNKKLIINRWFYFILYICTLEIASLFVLFSLIFS